jgi:hypothetical protein
MRFRRRKPQPRPRPVPPRAPTPEPVLIGWRWESSSDGQLIHGWGAAASLSSACDQARQALAESPYLEPSTQTEVRVKLTPIFELPNSSRAWMGG